MKTGFEKIACLAVFVFFAPFPCGAATLHSLGSSGMKAYEKGNYSKALDCYIKAQLQSPDNPKILYNLGNAHYKMGDYDAALANYRDALKKGDDSLKERIHYNMGNAYFRKGEFKKALSEYEQALKLDPNDLDAKKNMEFVKKVMEEQKKRRSRTGNQQNKTGNRQEKSSSTKDKNKSSSDKNRSRQANKSGGNGNKDKKQENHGGNGRQNQKGRTQQPGKEGQVPPPVKSENSGQDARARSGAGGEQNSGEQNAKQAERILNRLKDIPGRALIPSYQPRHVDRDW